jgi:hypothetical protein
MSSASGSSSAVIANLSGNVHTADSKRVWHQQATTGGKLYFWTLDPGYQALTQSNGEPYVLFWAETAKAEFLITFSRFNNLRRVQPTKPATGFRNLIERTVNVKTLTGGDVTENVIDILETYPGTTNVLKFQDIFNKSMARAIQADTPDKNAWIRGTLPYLTAEGGQIQTGRCKSLDQVACRHESWIALIYTRLFLIQQQQSLGPK